ncbi:hypothetical protein PHYBOEH_005591 [Phytophthora boehmeriae]|uniref:Transmembrane protein n=1 Tax=Phytophthora boehmeriae TaxID=109152 RepID=A0A8T1WP86_9STRA|nr:hypothetical protein PHYBOEH_005591 [Phytophthora boehmeriae]
MLGSSKWSTAAARPPRPRPTSAKLSASSTTYSRTALMSARPDFASYEVSSEDEEEEVVEDDDGDDDEAEFGAAAEQEHKRQQQQLQQAHSQQPRRRYWSGKQTVSTSMHRSSSKPTFRPASAPAGRPKSATTTRSARDKLSNEDKRKQRSAAAMSIAYLRAAAEKKKARDREFARELFREETEFRKKITVKIEQANKMMTALGSAKSYSSAPDRDGAHMIRVQDPASGSRVISVEVFHILSTFIFCILLFAFAVELLNLSSRVFSLREFEHLASVPLGHFASSPAGNNAPSKHISSSVFHSKTPSQRPRSGRLSSRPSSATTRDSQWEPETQRSRVKIKPADRTQVQEELRGVLESTIELTKVLQEQLHELKLKGWNVTTRC